MANETITPTVTTFSIEHGVSTPNLTRQRSASRAQESSFHASMRSISDTDRRRSVRHRLFRIVSLLSCSSLMIYFSVQAIRAYYGYPTQTSVAIVIEWPQDFPAVTVCNYSPLRYDRFVEPFLNYTNTFNLTSTLNVTYLNKEHSQYIHSFLLYRLNRDEALIDFFYPLEAMMMSCIYNGMPCTTANFTRFMSSKFGLCYTFNARLKQSFNRPVKHNSDNGMHGSLALRFYVHQHQYVPYLSNGIGMVALVHDNAHLPNIDMLAMLLASGRHHKLGYMKKTSLFLPTPYTSCNNKLNRGMQALFENHQDAEYGFSQLPCFWACMQAYIYEQCGCGHPFQWTVRSVVLPGRSDIVNISLCEIDNPCYAQAMTQFMNTKSIWMTYCPDCTQECSYSDFLIKSSSVLGPPPYLMDEIKEFVERSTVPLPTQWSTSWASEIHASYVSLEVAYETTRSEIYAQKATISLVDVISNVGGQTGLWIGISFFSLVEITEAIYRMLYSHCRCLWTTLRRQF